MAKKRKKKVVDLKYPGHALKPSDLLHFVCLDGFEDEWIELGLGEDEMEAMEIFIMCGAKDAPVIQGTGGLRKMRFAPESWNTGKSGAARVCFVYFPEWNLVVFVTVYRKSEHDSLSGECKTAIRTLIGQITDDLAKKGSSQ